MYQLKESIPGNNVGPNAPSNRKNPTNYLKKVRNEKKTTLAIGILFTALRLLCEKEKKCKQFPTIKSLGAKSSIHPP